MSETVKRYELRDVSTNPYSEFHQLRLDADGEWVEYADYAALAQQLADVAYLEEWVQRGNDPLLPQHYVAGLVGRRFGAFAGQDLAEVSADSLPALGARLRAMREKAS